MSTPRTVAFHTLGCKLNFSETSALSRMFESEGYMLVKFEEGADIYVINTCSVTELADKECRKIVRSLLRNCPEAYVIVTGCYAIKAGGDFGNPRRRFGPGRRRKIQDAGLH